MLFHTLLKFRVLLSFFKIALVQNLYEKVILVLTQ